MNTTTFLKFTTELARDAGAVILDWYERDFTIEFKSSEFDLVTEADRASEALIIGRIRESYPDHAILAEESGNMPSESPFRWVIDPLDGTSNFAHGLPHFSVSIALQQASETIVGVIYDPIRDELFSAARGEGAWLERGERAPRQLHVSKVTQLGQAMLATGFAYSRATTPTNNIAEFTRIIRRIRGVRRMASAALDFAYIAAGRLTGLWEYHLSPWDSTAGALLVSEAGGMICQLNGEAWTIFSLSTVATNPTLMPRLLEVLNDGEP